jgi:hypothetical protein
MRCPVNVAMKVVSRAIFAMFDNVRFDWMK